MCNTDPAIVASRHGWLETFRYLLTTAKRDKANGLVQKIQLGFSSFDKLDDVSSGADEGDAFLNGRIGTLIIALKEPI